VHPPVAPSAAEQEPPKFPFQFAPFVCQELYPEALRRGDEAGLNSGIGLVGFVHDSVGVPDSLGDGADGASRISRSGFTGQQASAPASKRGLVGSGST
jgi:hypothetical protein